MITLTLLASQKMPQQWTFEQESTIRIGRSPDNHVVLSDALVSRHHLELHNIGRSGRGELWQLANQGTNGTLLDGKLVSLCLLPDDCTIQLAPGGPILKFQAEVAAAPPAYTCTHAGNLPGNLFCIHCGQPLQVEGTIRDYQLLRSLGAEGMASTYLVWQPQPKAGRPQLQVLKEIHAEVAAVPKAQELFEREARTLRSLHHPRIPRFFDFFTEADKQYLVMELIHGQDLDQRVRQQGPVSPSQAIAWMVQTCEVLAYLHSQVPPVIHRDIKPSNLLVRNVDQQIVVVDFGAVKEAAALPGTRIAIEGYSAPEQEQGSPCPQSDLYAVGATLVFLLTGESPLKFYRKQASGYQIQLEDLPTLPYQLQVVIERATAPKLRDRFASATELALALNACLPCC